MADPALFHPDRGVLIAPSVLDANFGVLGDEIRRVESAGARLFHLDVMDGHFVPNLSIGVPIVSAISDLTNRFLDTHLMITDPGKYAPAFVKAGADSISFHIEASGNPTDIIGIIRNLGAKVGLAINPGTPAESIFDIIPLVDIVLVMTVWPGFGGQKFIQDCLPKIESLRKRLRPDQWLEVDGGINVETARLAVAAGADTLVAGSAIYRASDAAAAFSALRDAAQAGRAGLGR